MGGRKPPPRSQENNNNEIQKLCYRIKVRPSVRWLSSVSSRRVDGSWTEEGPGAAEAYRAPPAKHHEPLVSHRSAVPLGGKVGIWPRIAGAASQEHASASKL